MSAIISEHNDRVVDSLGICTWLWSLFIFQNIEKAKQFFNLVTGKDWSMEQMMKIGECIRHLERLFDVRQGLSRDMDSLPNKFFEKPLAKGKYKGAVLDREKFEKMKDEYYEQTGMGLGDRRAYSGKARRVGAGRLVGWRTAGLNRIAHNHILDNFWNSP